MGIEEPTVDIYQGSFELLCQSVKDRILGNDSTNDKLLKVISQLDGHSNGSTNSNHNSNCNGIVYEGCYTYNEENVGNECNIEDSDDSNVDLASDDNAVEDKASENSDRSYLNFRKALENLLRIYKKFKFDDNIGEIIRPPPVPVTDTFRTHNPEAANIYDFYDHEKEDISEFSDLTPVSVLWSRTLRCSVNTCLVAPKELDKEHKFYDLNQQKLIDSLNHGDYDSKEYYEMLKVLFSWYFSGYYTARMDLITQLDKKQ